MQVLSYLSCVQSLSALLLELVGHMSSAKGKLLANDGVELCCGEHFEAATVVDYVVNANARRVGLSK